MLLQLSGGQFKLAVHILGVKNTWLLITFLNLVFFYVKNKWQQHSIRFFTPTCGQTESKGQTYETYTNWRPGQYLTHAHSHITRAVAAMDSCLALTRTHQHGISSRRSYDMNAQSPVSMAASPLPGWCCCGFNSHVVEMLLKVSSKHTHLIGMAIRAIIALGHVYMGRRCPE